MAKTKKRVKRLKLGYGKVSCGYRYTFERGNTITIGEFISNKPREVGSNHLGEKSNTLLSLELNSLDSLIVLEKYFKLVREQLEGELSTLQLYVAFDALDEGIL